MAAAKLDHDGDALVSPRGTAAPERMSHVRSGSERRLGADVADPVGVCAPGRADDRLAGVRVVRQRHCEPSRGACRSCDLGGRSAGRCVRASTPSRGGRAGAAPHYRKRETSGLPAEPEQRLRGTRGFVRGSRHDFVTGGLKIRDSYAWVTAATCCGTRAKADADHLRYELPPASPAVAHSASGKAPYSSCAFTDDLESDLGSFRRRTSSTAVTRAYLSASPSANAPIALGAAEAKLCQEAR